MMLLCYAIKSQLKAFLASHIVILSQVLDLSFNNLLRIDENVLRERNLYNLQKIYLRHCSIQVVIGRCFEGITNLVELDLSYNLIQVIPKEALKDCRYLMSLSLKGNPIRRVSRDTFDNLADLQVRNIFNLKIKKRNKNICSDPGPVPVPDSRGGPGLLLLPRCSPLAQAGQQPARSAPAQRRSAGRAER